MRRAPGRIRTPDTRFRRGFRSSIRAWHGGAFSHAQGIWATADGCGCSLPLMSVLDFSGTALVRGRPPAAHPADRPSSTRRAARCTSTTRGRRAGCRLPGRRARSHRTSWAGCTRDRPGCRWSCGAPYWRATAAPCWDAVRRRRPGPQPTTVSHDGGPADRPGARVPRCTPTGLSHASRSEDQSKPRRPVREDGAGALSLGITRRLSRMWSLTCGNMPLAAAVRGSVAPVLTAVDRPDWHVVARWGRAPRPGRPGPPDRHSHEPDSIRQARTLPRLVVHLLTADSLGPRSGAGQQLEPEPSGRGQAVGRSCEGYGGKAKD